MKTYLINTYRNLSNTTQVLDFISTIRNTEWIVYNDDNQEVEKFLFVSDDNLLVSVNGKTKESKWQYIKINKSLVIDNGNSKYLFKIRVFNKDIVVLNIDSTNSYTFLINSKSELLVEPTFEKIQWYLIRECQFDILSDSQRNDYEQELSRKREEESILIKKNKDKRARQIRQFYRVLGFLFIVLVVGFSIHSYIQYKKLHPTILITEETNRNAVDLGLSVKWASCNLGANSPEEYGNYYGWGDPTGQDIFRYYDDIIGDLCKRFPVRSSLEPPISIINSQNDIVKQNWGKKWRMPSVDECRELIEKCTIEYIEYKRVKCAKLTGPNGNYIILPSAAFKSGDEGNWMAKYNEYCIYIWSGELIHLDYHSPELSKAAYLALYEDMFHNKPIVAEIKEMDRYENLPVRGVTE